MFHHYQVPTGVLDGVSFCTYKSEEIKKLSVLEVTNPVAFDILGHPTKDGVYDLKLGPSDRGEICGTCGLSCIRCPGHLGHISLPLPVFNPLVIRTAFNLLRGTCFYCHHFRLSPIVCNLVSSQLKALSYGLVWTAKEMEAVVGELLAGESSKHAATLIAIETELSRLLKDALEGIDKEAARKELHVKNVIECHRSITKGFMRDHIGHAPRSCVNCGKSKRNLALENNTRMIVGPASRKGKIKIADKKVKKEVDSHNHVENEKEEAEIAEDEKSIRQVYLTPREAQVHLQQVYDNHKELMMQLFGALVGNNGAKSTSPVDGFFIEVLPVPPSRFRPILRMGDKKFDNPHSSTLSKVIKDCIVLRHLLRVVKSDEEIEASENVKALLSSVMGKTAHEKLTNAWFDLQAHVNSVFDSDMNKFKSDGIPGIKQTLERKEGLFRKHMMGKRVNYAARSVISPDPYIDVDEIGVPEIFAKKLTYPQPVTPWNIKELRQAVINGPDTYPGAALVKNQDGSVVMLGKDKIQREAIAKQLLTPSIHNKLPGCKIVYRHLRNGDILLLNRQPTLHKPSIMAHKARVLPGEKTLRLNYSNCKTYNADFDGDEMNAHFPQGEVARSEAFAIANVNNQYLVPKDGTPLGGLIQDHIISAVLLMIRGRFFDRSDYQQLVFGALARTDACIRTLPPSILRPLPCWSGKQVISTIIINTIPVGKQLLCISGKAKIPLKSWQKYPPRPWLAGGTQFRGLEMSESEVVIRNGELLCGILDKAHLGATPYGLIHCCHELYGGDVSGMLLSQLGRLFTHFLRLEGFSLGVEDILVTEKADKKRMRLMRHARKAGDKVVCEALGLPLLSTDKNILNAKLAEAHLADDDRQMKELDMCMKVTTDNVNNDINKVCMPDGLLKQFPNNNLQLMVISGAKGATVNCMQISCLLGQIELEGRRPPLMISGCSLPSFLPYDTSPRAGGFVDGRFLTGIRPQEYFFHCMAGREGLIDTAVKTSRSGYLQRCLIKHLEGIAVGYDLTVRDSDGSVIQFQYGEDALDIPKLQFLNRGQLSFLVENSKAVHDEQAVAMVLEKCDYHAVLKYTRKVRKWVNNLSKAGDPRTRTSGFLRYSEFHLPELKSKFSGFNSKTHRDLATEKLLEMWFQLEENERKQLDQVALRTLEPVSAKYRPDVHLGGISETMDQVITSYINDGLHQRMKKSDFTKMMHNKILTSVCQPGEAVGLLAAQSIGEPSTQMTLNTFHFAGRGEMNVTLGIPRLREILMTASANIATPALEVPFLTVPKLDKKAEKLRKKLSRVYLSEVLELVKVQEKLCIKTACKNRVYTLFFQFLQHKTYKKSLIVTPPKILYFMETVFFKHLTSAMKGKIHLITQSTLVSNVTMREKEGPMAKTEDEMAAAAADDDKDPSEKEKPLFKDDMEGDDSSADEEEENDATAVRNRTRHDQEREYEELDEEEKNLQEKASDEENDDDDEHKSSLDERSHTSSPVFWEDVKPNLSELIGEDETQSSAPKYSANTPAKELSVEAGQRILNVVRLNDWITDYRYDTEKQEWCELTITMDITIKKVDLNVLVKEEVAKAVVHHTQGIKRAFVIEQRNANGSTSTVLKTEGVNITEMYKYDDLLDLRSLYTNDIHTMARIYGIEAARRAVVKEIQNVFKVYGIEVDPRHLLLIADYMTFEGAYKPFNRLGMESSASPLQQMSFETTMHFLKLATVSGICDPLKSPSSRLVVGRPVGCGTGSFDLIQPLKIRSRRN